MLGGVGLPDAVASVQSLERGSACGTGVPGDDRNVTLEKVGDIAVDSGLVLLCDPCRVVGQQYPEFGSSWEAFIAKVKRAVTPIGKGVALAVGGFGGDGVYPVYIERDERGLVAAVTVRFDPPTVERKVRQDRKRTKPSKPMTRASGQGTPPCS